MKERPILFKGEMVRALLDGRKTQTRRAINPQPELTEGSGFSWKCWLFGSGATHAETVRNFAHKSCPYGKPGDRLWVRETFGYEIRSVRGTPHEQVVYRASKPDAVRCYDCSGMESPMKWRPSIHMPRWASRITLEITSVRVERLQDISETDALAEGVVEVATGGGKSWSPTGAHDDKYSHDPRQAYQGLWTRINGPGSWGANPWVWVVEFKRVDQGGEQ